MNEVPEPSQKSQGLFFVSFDLDFASLCDLSNWYQNYFDSVVLFFFCHFTIVQYNTKFNNRHPPQLFLKSYIIWNTTW